MVQFAGNFSPKVGYILPCDIEEQIQTQDWLKCVGAGAVRDFEPYLAVLCLLSSSEQKFFEGGDQSISQFCVILASESALLEYCSSSFID